MFQAKWCKLYKWETLDYTRKLKTDVCRPQQELDCFCSGVVLKIPAVREREAGLEFYLQVSVCAGYRGTCTGIPVLWGCLDPDVYLELISKCKLDLSTLNKPRIKGVEQKPVRMTTALASASVSAQRWSDVYVTLFLRKAINRGVPLHFSFLSKFYWIETFCSIICAISFRINFWFLIF